MLGDDVVPGIGKKSISSDKTTPKREVYYNGRCRGQFPGLAGSAYAYRKTTRFML